MVWRILGVACLALGLGVGTAWAQTPLPSAQAQEDAPLFDPSAKAPDVNTIPVLANMVRGGNRLFPLGVRSGLFGWLIVKDGQIQMIYLAPDGKSVLIGALFSDRGDDVTGPQIATLVKANKEVAVLVNARQQKTVAAAMAPGGASSAAESTNLASTISKMSVPGSLGDRLYQEMALASGVVVGHNDKAQIMMVIDPNCPHCQATWKEFREAVLANHLQIKLIPIGRGEPENERAAARLLKAANPLESWDKYVGGDKSVLAGEADPMAAIAVKTNAALVDRWNISYTPYLVYRNKEGVVKIVQGKPEQMATVLSDLPQ